MNHVVAIVTGGAQGLGLAFATAILAQGGRVLITDINGQACAASCEQLNKQFGNRAASAQQDVCDDGSFDKVFDAAERAFGSVNVLVNNAGIALPPNTFYDNAYSADWRKLMEINVVAVMRGTQVALRRLSKATAVQPIVVNISSVSAIWPVVELPEYSTSKAAVVAFSTAVGKQVKNTKIRVVSICPSFADTAMGRAAEASDSKLVGNFGELMTPAFVARGVVQLISDTDNSGQVMMVTNRGIKYRGASKPKAKLETNQIDMVHIAVVPEGPSLMMFGLNVTKGYASKKTLITTSIVSIIGFIVTVLIGIDTVANNWVVNNYLGNGMCFVTPVATVQNLQTEYSFAQNHGVKELSKVGKWMLNSTISSLVTKSNAIYILYGGSYRLTNEMDLCSIFKATYLINLNTTRTLQLGVTQNLVTFYKETALSHLFTNDAAENLGDGTMTSAQLNNLGYAPGRNIVDLRMTNGIKLIHSSIEQKFTVSYYRIFSKALCTGCDPIAELGFGTCNMTLVYDDKDQKVTVIKSDNIPNSIYKLGLICERSTFSSVSHYIKLLAIVFAVGGYLASRLDPTKQVLIIQRIIRTVLPKYFPHPSHALSFSMFCYNSDIYVFLFSAGVAFDMENCLLYLRHVNQYNSLQPNYSYTLQIYALSIRMLWFNCAGLKIFKIVWSIISSADHCGESRIMGFLNLSCVTSLYLSAIALFYVAPFIEYNNSINQELDNNVESLDPIHIDIFDSYYIRVTPAIIVGLLINLFVVTALDHLWAHKHWSELKQNSLPRQAILNSSSILCDYLCDVEGKNENTSVIECKARRLSTLQWYFMCHLTCFGLPEKELRAKKAKNQTLNKEEGSMYMVVQDGDRNIHLIDAQFADVTAMEYNIKILKDTSITIN
ncbi:hypothetical protein THRCLA_03493 [Thraustotheca clavata]|uniref:Uncharacterized protein n=1 Tax=Thraustotheca clavata TaxID=74557 RepID=A0A1W0ACL8_9STRA|nr:hypothetical protein THRCLA_03493 [Thraustotheca clavata]